MLSRLCTAVLLFSLAAPAQTLSVQQLITFLRNAAKTTSDKELAAYLAKVKLSERLDAGTIEDLQGLGAGPRTLQALEKLKRDSASLAPAAPLVEPPKPKPIPPPSSEEQAAIITAVRKYALEYSRNLPDFICAQVTRRKVAPTTAGKYKQYAGSNGPSWQTMDTLTIRLSYFEQKENYKLLLRNNTAITEDYAKLGGPKAFGSFGSLLREVFEPRSQARFEWDRWATLRQQRVMVFNYRVAQLNSQYHLSVDDLKLSIVTAYRGLVYIDPATHAVLRVTVVGFDIPHDFPIKAAETTLDYDFQDLSGHKFLLPLKAQILMTSDDVLTGIDEEFRLYRKYSAESELKFDTEPLPPLPEEKPEEKK